MFAALAAIFVGHPLPIAWGILSSYRCRYSKTLLEGDFYGDDKQEF